MRAEITVPPVGESITEGVIAEWSKKDGEFVEIDDQLFDLETDKITMPVNSAFKGRLTIKAAAGEKVKIGDVVGFVDTDAAKESAAKEAPAKEKKESAAVAATEKVPAKAHDAAVEEIAPSARKLIEEYGLDAAAIQGTGKAGRITKEDVLKAIEDQKRAAAGKEVVRPSAAPARPTTPPTRPITLREEPAPSAVAEPKPAGPVGERRQTRTPMSPLRQRVAERLLDVHHSTAMVTTFNEVDMTAVLRLREHYSETFEKRYGVRLGFMSFFIKASVDALKTVPSLNAYIDGDSLVQNHFYDIGVAVSTDKGLVVPILRDCDRKTMPEIEKEVLEVATRARERKLTLDDLAGGSFSISNGGVFGSLLSTPMLNPPQSGILGMHTIKKRPVVIDDRIEVRPMMYLALTYDHRVVDGREGVTFLKRLAECIENPDRMFLEV